MKEKIELKPVRITAQPPVQVDASRVRYVQYWGGADDPSTRNSYEEFGGNWWDGGSREYDPRNDQPELDRGLYQNGGEIPLFDPQDDPEWHPGKN